MKRNKFEEMSMEERRALELLGSLRTYRGALVIAHPGKISSQLLELLGRLEKHGVRTSIEGFSPYSPSRPFSVVLWQAQDEELARGYLELAREWKREGRKFAHDAVIN